MRIPVLLSVDVIIFTPFHIYIHILIHLARVLPLLILMLHQLLIDFSTKVAPQSKLTLLGMKIIVILLDVGLVPGVDLLLRWFGFYKVIWFVFLILAEV